MADRRGILVPLIILGFIFLTPAPPQQSVQLERLRIEDVIADEQRSLAAVQNSTYGAIDGAANDAYLVNVTGFEPDRNYAWHALPQVKDRAKERVDYVLGDWGKQALDGNIDKERPVALYQNATGLVHGKWLRSKLQDRVNVPHLNLSMYAPEGPFGPTEPRDFDRNITGEGGDVSIRFHESSVFDSSSVLSRPVNMTRMMIEMTIQDTASSDEWDIRAHGVYLPNLGQAVLTTTSSKFAGIFMLPHFALSEYTFNSTRAFLNSTISKTIDKQYRYGFQAPLNPWSSNPDGEEENMFSRPECEMIIYLQQLEPLTTSVPYSSGALSFLENELRFPTGAFMPREPDLRFSMITFSPDCGFVIESQGPPDQIPQNGNHLTGSKIEIFHANARHHLLIFTLAVCAQLFLMMRQMREASTPSTRSRVSIYTVAFLAFGDCFTSISFIILGLAVGGLAVDLLGAAFLSFLGGAFFGMKFLLDVWLAQAPERAESEREERELERQRQERIQAAFQRFREERRARLLAAITARNQNPPQSDQTQPENESAETPDTAPLLAPEQPAAPDSLPLPVTAQRPTDTGATPVFMPSDQEGLEPIDLTTTGAGAPLAPGSPIAGFSTIYTRFFLVLLATLFLSLNALTWPPAYRHGYFACLSTAYLSLWLPQIFRNIARNSRRALTREFLAAQSLLRLLPFAYFYAYPRNILSTTSEQLHPRTLLFLTGWLWLQVVLLLSQDLLGPRWFVPSGWAPPAYDYHPVLRADADEEGGTDGLPLGLSMDLAGQGGEAPGSPTRLRRASTASTHSQHKKDAKRGAVGSGTRVFDCAICMQELEVLVVEKTAGGTEGDGDERASGPGLLARRAYMVTPCRHIFHSACLEGWMKYRLQCPNCREGLPGL